MHNLAFLLALFFCFSALKASEPSSSSSASEYPSSPCTCPNCLAFAWRSEPETGAFQLVLDESLPVFPQIRRHYSRISAANSISQMRQTGLKFTTLEGNENVSDSLVMDELTWKSLACAFFSRFMSEALDANLLALNRYGELIVPNRKFSTQELEDFEIIGYFMCKALKYRLPLGYHLAPVLVEVIQTAKPFEIETKFFYPIDLDLVAGLFKFNQLSLEEKQEIGCTDFVTDLAGFVEATVKERIVNQVALPLTYLALGFSAAAEPRYYKKYSLQKFIDDLKGANRLTPAILSEKLNFIGPHQDWFLLAFLSLSPEEQLLVLAEVAHCKYLTADSLAAMNGKLLIWIENSNVPMDYEYIRASSCSKTLNVPPYSSLEVMIRNMRQFVQRIEAKN